jgi:Holliday junction resolvasome RuvABC endonuclease subunit
MRVKILGVDISLANLGTVVVSYDTESEKIVGLDTVLLTSTDDQAGKTVRKNSDDLRRAKDLVRSLRVMSQGCRLACVEMPVGSQNARSMASYGICVGVMASCPVPLIQVTPFEVKLAATGNRNASKQEMIEWAVEKHPDASWIRHKSKGEMKLTAANEHLADALAAVYAGILTDQFKQAMSIVTSIAA